MSEYYSGYDENDELSGSSNYSEQKEDSGCGYPEEHKTDHVIAHTNADKGGSDHAGYEGGQNISEVFSHSASSSHSIYFSES